MAKKSFPINATDIFLSNAAKDPAQVNGGQIPPGYRLVREQKSARIQLLTYPNTKETLRREAFEQGISLNELINNIFDEYLGRGNR